MVGREEHGSAGLVSHHEGLLRYLGVGVCEEDQVKINDTKYNFCIGSPGLRRRSRIFFYTTTIFFVGLPRKPSRPFLNDLALLIWNTWKSEKHRIER